MGWWKIENIETGQIARTHPSGHPGNPLPGQDRMVINAVPGRDAIGDYYNGDGPADIMDQAIDDVCRTYKREWNRPPHLEEIEAVINFVMNPMRNGKKPIDPDER